MITDQETNLLYLSKKLTVQSEFFDNLEMILKRSRIEFNLLSSTNDIWCVDYMPLQKSDNEFIQFRYEPDYLQTKKYISTQTNPTPVCEAINIHSVKSRIKIDGGNVIKGKDWVILTDKIFKENITIQKEDLINELENLFGAKPIIVPHEPYDYTGHADGILRYYDHETVLINNYPPGDNKEFQRKLKLVLSKEGLKTIPIPYHPGNDNNSDEATGLYINYLQMKNFILLPSFEMAEDEVAIRVFEQLFPACQIETINASVISKDGGVLNCITWNIKANLINS